MGDLTDKFVIDKDFDNQYVITIKRSSSTLAIAIDPTDTFEFRLYPLLGGTATVTLDLTDGITVADADNGKIQIDIPQTIATTLTAELGDKADRYYIKPTYRGAIKCVTSSEGEFVAYIGEVYVR